MEKKNIIPQAAKPVVRITQGTQADLLSELSEEVLSTTTGACASFDTGIRFCGDNCGLPYTCSYDGDDA